MPLPPPPPAGGAHPSPPLTAAHPPRLLYQLVVPGVFSDEVLASGGVSASAWLAPPQAGGGVSAMRAAGGSSGARTTSDGTSDPGGEEGWVDATLPLVLGGGGGGGGSGGGTGAYLAVRVRWRPLCPGVLLLSLRDAEWSVNRDLLGAQDPYIRVSAPGGCVATSLVQHESGRRADFRGQVLRLWLGPEAWGGGALPPPLRVAAFDRDTFKPDDLIGAASVDPVAAGWIPRDWLAEAEAAAAAMAAPGGWGGGGGGGLLEDARGGGAAHAPPPAWEREAGVELPMYAPDVKRGPCGHVRLGVRFVPAGELVVRVVEARRLGTSAASPYVTLSTDSALLLGPGPAGGHGAGASAAAAGAVVRTPAHRGGGAFPTWGTTLSLDLLDATQLFVRVMDTDVFTGDQTLGEAVVELAPLYRTGVRDAWLPLVRLGGWGDESAVGELRVELDFMGPRGMAFPQLRPGVAAGEGFDERERLQRVPFPAAAAAAGRPAEGGGAFTARSGGGAAAAAAATTTPRGRQAGGAGTPRASSAGRAAAMSQRDIEAAFDGLDLDHNRYVGAAELRHALACLGEAVTDAEVDAMLELVDADGDGMVSFYEFAALMATQADPKSPSFAAQLRASVARTDPEVGPVAAGGGGGGGGAALRGQLSPPPIVLPPSTAGGSGIVVGSDPAARRAAMARADELTRRAAKRTACQAFVRRRRLQLRDLRAWAAGVPRAQLTQAATAELLVHVVAAAASSHGGSSCASSAGGLGSDGDHHGAAADAEDVAALLEAFKPPAASGSAPPRPPALPSRLPLPPPPRPHPDAAAAAQGPPPPAARGTSLRELLLSLSAFVGASREQRLLLCFELLDADGSGSLSRGELGEVLASQHLLGDAAWVAKKVDDVFALVDADHSGQIELREFRQLATQFGSLLMPEYQQDHPPLAPAVPAAAPAAAAPPGLRAPLARPAPGL